MPLPLGSKLADALDGHGEGEGLIRGNQILGQGAGTPAVVAGDAHLLEGGADDGVVDGGEFEIVGGVFKLVGGVREGGVGRAKGQGPR